MITFLFWNSKNASAELVATLVKEHQADVLMLAETKLDASSVLHEIQRTEGASFSSDVVPARVALYTRFPTPNNLVAAYDQDLMSMRRIRTQREELLLVLVHLRSKESTSKDGQAALVPQYAHEIRRIEDKLGHRRTILVGDLNMDPYENGVVQMNGFHAIPSHRIATDRGRAKHKGEREVDGAYYPFFYNPMWNCFGDERNGPGGTYFRDKADPIAYFWHIYDQVLVRPALVPCFRHQDLRILTRAGSSSLLNNKGQPDASDHLPIIFRLDLDPPGAAP